MVSVPCIFSTFANLDLEEIADYIARDNPRRALSYIGEIRDRCRSLISFPEAAPLREEFGAGIRVVPFGRYLIFYTTQPDAVRIEPILPGSRNLSSDDFLT
ncbi:type II toxin-antitoxin system RelE/ParE family toxin [Gloeobacter morelensis]|uniref:Type II toxin-antitoxin system RelE/ParE family toxin n=1 Tax=Gloeobacter morelensis MG652769 TaxID=2781736 RepID=A0ABY3PRP6_9CYAN|nr:type II toxin-antitoxin system RelE/ParE family toxin [Gloeobacter morelensis]UFP96345.1 type II toxin-antitoxin system RelE/ParE family toxin [Gloeobacter morelensis MG652769]